MAVRKDEGLPFDENLNSMYISVDLVCQNCSSLTNSINKDRESTINASINISNTSPIKLNNCRRQNLK